MENMRSKIIYKIKVNAPSKLMIRNRMDYFDIRSALSFEYRLMIIEMSKENASS